MCQTFPAPEVETYAKDLALGLNALHTAYESMSDRLLEDPSGAEELSENDTTIVNNLRDIANEGIEDMFRKINEALRGSRREIIFDRATGTYRSSIKK